MWSEYISPASIPETLKLLDAKREKARIVAGATDLMLELERGIRKGIETLIDITRIPDLDQITIDDNAVIHIGPLVTHNDAASSQLLRERAFPLVSAAWQVGAPQIRNRATVAGNLITASPANDTIPALEALGAWVELTSISGNRRISLSDFYTGVRRTVLRSDEMLVDIAFPALPNSCRGTFLKLGLRRAQAISIVNTAVVLDLDENSVRSAIITLGAVAPTIIHAAEAEVFLSGRIMTEDVIDQSGELAAKAALPIDDIRGSATYRRAMVKVLVTRSLRMLRDGCEHSLVPETPVLLQTHQVTDHAKVNLSSLIHGPTSSIKTTINGRKIVFNSGYDKSLLRLLREDAGMIGTKEGCAEGECGACTIFLDGKAVMACLVPAPRAEGAEIVTVEGLSAENMNINHDEAGVEGLHPVQQAFIIDGAVQCGYCSPGFIMSAVKLLEEHPHPTRNEITQALTGNLCRCTGYYKIIQAVEDASRQVTLIPQGKIESKGESNDKI